MTIFTAWNELKKLSLADRDELLPGFNEKQVLLTSNQLIEAVKILLANNIFHLSTITGVYQENSLQLLYHFWKGEGITLRVEIDEQDNQVDSLTEWIPGALFYEREITEMFGVKINGLNMSNKMFLPDNWEGDAPMRRAIRVGNDEQQQEHK